MPPRREDPPAGPSRWFATATVATVCLTAIVYSPALRGPQIYDDMQSIQGNPSIVHLWPLSVPLHPPAGMAVSGRPLVNLSLAFNYWLNGALGVDQSPDPGGPDKTLSYHLVNLAFHIGCGLLLLGIARRTLAAGRMGERWSRRADPFALLLAGIWLLHPIQTEAVDYIIQRTEILVSFCYLATLYCSVRAWDALLQRSRTAWLTGGIVFCALGMTAKEVMVSAPIIIFLYDRAFRVSSWRALLSVANGRRWFYGALAATWTILVALLWNQPRGVTVGAADWLPPLEYLHTQGWAILHYLRLAFFPNALSIDYSYHAVEHWHGIPGLLVLSVFGALTLVAWAHANRWGWFGFLGAWFFLILAPSSSVVPILTELVAERRIYLALGAVVALTLVGIDAAWQFLLAARNSAGHPLSPSAQRAIAVGAVGVVAATLSVATFQRSRLYQSPEMLWRDAVAKMPGDPRAWVNLGTVLATGVPPRRALADSMFREALRRDSLFPDALLNVGIDEMDARDYADAEPRFRRFLAFDSTSAIALGGFAKLLLMRGDTAEALPILERYVQREPNVDAFMVLSMVYLSRGRETEAAAAVQRAVTLAPSNVDLLRRLGGMLLEQGHAEQASPYLNELARREPDSGIDLALLSLGQATLGHSLEAVQNAERAVRLGRDNQSVYFYTGRAMAVARRDDLAELYLARAVTLEPGDADAITQLAKVKSTLGKKAEAADLFRRALRIAPNDSAARAGLARVP